MQFKLSTSITMLAAMLFAVSAAPAADANVKVRSFECYLYLCPRCPFNLNVPQARSTEVDGDIFICTDANWSGDCTTYGFFSGVCSNFPPEFQDDISSVGPNPGWSCNLYV